MALLATDAYRFALGRALSEARQSISLVSAFVTIPGIEWVIERLARPADLRVLARWRCVDLAFQASHLEVYPLLLSRGARLYVHPELHAKLVLVDNRQLLIGSANVTSLGLQLVPGGNREMGVELQATPEDLTIVENLFDEAVEVDQDLYGAMRAHLEQIDIPDRIEIADWPMQVAARLTRTPARLWVAELFWTSGPRDLLEYGPDRSEGEVQAARHDLALLGFGFNVTGTGVPEAIRDRFLRSRAWRWLEASLRSSGREMYFGELSARLHNLLLDDPRPYRKDVKGLLSNLLNWAAAISDSPLALDRPDHSQRVRLN